MIVLHYKFDFVNIPQSLFHSGEKLILLRCPLCFCVHCAFSKCSIKFSPLLLMIPWDKQKGKIIWKKYTIYNTSPFVLRTHCLSLYWSTWECPYFPCWWWKLDSNSCAANKSYSLELNLILKNITTCLLHRGIPTFYKTANFTV